MLVDSMLAPGLGCRMGEVGYVVGGFAVTRWRSGGRGRGSERGEKSGWRAVLSRTSVGIGTFFVFVVRIDVYICMCMCIWEYRCKFVYISVWG